MRLAIIGGGIAGLAGAWYARIAAREAGLPLEIALFEESHRLGGKVWTQADGDPPVEWGPDSFLAAKPAARRLAEELGIDGELVAPGPSASRTYLVVGGRLRPLPRGLAMGIPTGIGPLIATVRQGLIGPLAALRAAAEPLLPRTDTTNLTAEEFFRKRLGRQAASRLVGPLVSGVFGVPADEVGVAAALPQFAHLRSLVLAMARRPPASGPIFLSFRAGMGRLVDVLAGRLAGEDIRLSSPVEGMTSQNSGYLIQTQSEEERADAVLLAAPAAASARLLSGIAADSAVLLRGIRYHDSAVMRLLFPPDAFRQPLDGAGYLVAPEEEGVVAACSWVGTKWPHLASDAAQVRVIATSPEALALSDDMLISRATAEIGRVMGARCAPMATGIRRWPSAMPVYAPGHREKVASARRALPARLALAGAAYDGVGVPDCIRTGQEAARQLVQVLAATSEM